MSTLRRAARSSCTRQDRAGFEWLHGLRLSLACNTSRKWTAEHDQGTQHSPKMTAAPTYRLIFPMALSLQIYTSDT